MRWLPLAFEIGWRYLRGRKSRLLSGTARAALGSIGLGVTAMVVAMSLMNGYTEELQGKMLQSGAVIVTPLGDSGPDDPRPRSLYALEPVADVTYAAFAQASVASSRYPQGLDVYLRGVVGGTGRFGASPELLAADDSGTPGVVLGNDLARRLGVERGEHLRVVALGLDRTGARYHYLTLRFAGTFATGFSQFDQAYAVVDHSIVERLGIASGIWEVAVTDPDQVDEVVRLAEDRLGSDFLVRDWRLSNPGLFTALKLQKWGLFLILGLIVIVSTFNVASTLIVMVREHMRDIGALSAMGLRSKRLRATFVICGGVLALGGTAIGLLAGSSLSWAFTELGLLRFDPEVAQIYFLSSVPFRVRATDLTAIAAFTMGVTVAACWLPARRATSLDPAVALRYE